MGLPGQPDRIVLRPVEDHLPLVEKSLPSSRWSVRAHVDDLQSPPAYRGLAPEMDGEEGPGVEPLAQRVPGPREQQGRAGT